MPNRPALSVQDARALAANLFPLAITAFRPLGQGWDHEVFLMNNEFVVRFPRNELAAKGLALELEFLPNVAKKVAARVPNTRWSATFPGYGWPVAAHEIIGVETVCDANLDREARGLLARPLGRFLRSLHRISRSELKGIPTGSLPGDDLGRMDVEGRSPWTLDRIRRFDNEGVLDPSIVGQLTKMIEETPPLVREATVSTEASESVVAHGDLHSRNVIAVDAQGGFPIGVIDWVDLHFGEAPVDLAVAFEVLPPDARTQFFAEYGRITDNALLRARWRAIDHATRALNGSLADGDDRFARACRRVLMEIAE